MASTTTKATIQQLLTVRHFAPTRGVAKALRFHGNRLRYAVLQHMSTDNLSLVNLISHFQANSLNSIIAHKGLENITVSEILKTKGKDEAGELFTCLTSDRVYDAVESMMQHNIGALVVVKPEDDNQVAGIITERDYLREIVVQERSPKDIRVADIMTDENKLITVSSNTKILKAMEIMSDKHIRHMPVIDKKVVGIISIVDVVKAIVDQQHQEVKRLNEFIRGDYY